MADKIDLVAAYNTLADALSRHSVIQRTDDATARDVSQLIHQARERQELLRQAILQAETAVLTERFGKWPP